MAQSGSFTVAELGEQFGIIEGISDEGLARASGNVAVSAKGAHTGMRAGPGMIGAVLRTAAT